MAAMPAKKEGLEGLIEWAKGIYVFGLFSKNAERPPWYINPLFTPSNPNPNLNPYPNPNQVPQPPHHP